MRNLTYKRVDLFFKKIGILILLSSFLSLYVASQILESDPKIESVYSNETLLSYHGVPRASIIHDPIFIDGDDPANDWDIFLNKTGSGTFVDPYLIENLEIDAGGTGSGIFIQDSDVYAEIINCTLFNAGESFEDAGIRLFGCSNVKLMNCTSEFNGCYGIYIENESFNILISGNVVTNNTHFGIFLESSSDNILSENVANLNGNGISLYESSDNNTIFGNAASYNTFYGFNLDSSSNNNISGNNARFNNRTGIYLESSSSNNSIFENNVSYNVEVGIGLTYSSDHNMLSGNDASHNNESGIELGLSNNNSILWNSANFNEYWGINLQVSSDNTISDNNANHNKWYGFRIWESSTNNTIFRNTARNNSQYGISVHTSVNNTIFFNNFLENIIREADCSNFYRNSWDNGTHGNYWGDYEVYYSSASNDGTIWNTPYQLNLYNIDNYPLVDLVLPSETATESSAPTGEGVLGPIDPIQLILSIGILVAVGLVGVKKLMQKKDSASEDDIYIDFQTEKPKKNPKKAVLDSSEAQSYIYDPDEPRLK